MLCCDYKIASLVITKRLGKIMPHILGSYQFGGIKGRKAQHILSVLRDVLYRRDEITRKKNEVWKLAYFLSVDVEKAYDSVEREILWSLMILKYGFHEDFVRMFKSLYQKPVAAINVYGSLTRRIDLEISLR